MKQKYRYLLIELSIEIKDTKQFISDLHTELMNMLGIYYYKFNLKIVSFPNEKTFIMKCANSYLGHLIVAFTFIKYIKSQPVYFYTLKSSGTILSLRKYISAELK